MKTICFIAPYNYSIPAIQGGAIETLVQHLIEENEKEKKFKFIVKNYLFTFFKCFL